MIRVAVAGAGGRMGQVSCRAIIAADDMELVAAVDPKAAGIDVRQVVAGDAPSMEIAGHIEVLKDAGTEVVVDFTSGPAARQNLPWYAQNGIHAVVGTTGFTARDLSDAERAFASSSANAVITANFAIGAVLLMRFCELAAPFMDGVEVIELHHDAKVDAPSGTAMRTAECIAAARRAAGSRPLPADSTTQLQLEGARGGNGAGGVRVHSVRLPGLVAHEEVIFGTAGQSLTIRHDSYDRESFMPGVLLAVRQVATHPGVTIGLNSLLGI